MIAALLLLLGGCGVGNGRPKTADHPGDSLAVDSDSAVDSPDSGPIDADADGYGADVDCDDQDPAVHPDAADVCNGADDDCDGATDEDTPEWHVDEDGDGYGSAATIQACDPPATATSDTSDCDDADADVHPEAIEWCGDGVDQDCDGGDLVCAAQVDAATLGLTVFGDVASHPIGHAQIGAGDLDGDGLDDLVIGAPETITPGVEGFAYVLTAPLLPDESTATANATLHCSDSYASPLCGWGAAAVGDVDGDGVGDVVVGVPTLLDTAAAVLYRGPVAGDLAMSSAATVWSTAAGSRLASDVVGADLNGDGLSDVVLADPYHPSGDAAALIFYSPLPASLLESDADASVFAGGYAPFPDRKALSARGDLDGDGYIDLVYGRYSDVTYAHDSGAVYAFRGPFDGDRQPFEADATIYGTDRFQLLGNASDFCGDQNGDGADDVIVGSAAAGTLPAAAYVVLTPLDGARVMPDDADATYSARGLGDADAAFAADIEYLDDLDGDGFGDVVITSFRDDPNGFESGRAWLLFGPLLGVNDPSAAAAMQITGTEGSEFGDLTGYGDVDGDGVTDLLVGALTEGVAGAVHVFMGADLVAESGR